MLGHPPGLPCTSRRCKCVQWSDLATSWSRPMAVPRTTTEIFREGHARYGAGSASTGGTRRPGPLPGGTRLIWITMLQRREHQGPGSNDRMGSWAALLLIVRQRACGHSMSGGVLAPNEYPDQFDERADPQHELGNHSVANAARAYAPDRQGRHCAQPRSFIKNGKAW